MIFGCVSIDDGAVNTHRDSYLLPTLTVVSVRRPFLAGGMIFGMGFAGFGAAFADLLYQGEIIVIIAGCLSAFIGGIGIGQLKLLSRDLRGSELAGMIWGSYGHLNRIRADIVHAMRSHPLDVRS